MQVAIRITENDGPARAMHFVAPSVLLVGRHSDCDLRLEGDLVSRKHARIMLGSTAFIVEDLSANGTEVTPSLKLHGERRELEYGSQLRIGPFALTIGDVPVPGASRPGPPPVPRRSAPPPAAPSGGTLLSRSQPPPPSSLPAAPFPPGTTPTPLGVQALALVGGTAPRIDDAAGGDDTSDRAILPLFAPILPLLSDPAISLVRIDGPGQVLVERGGELRKTDARFPSPKAVILAVRAAVQYGGRPLDDDSPVLEGRLPEGWRLTAVLPPAARGGPYVTLRRSSRDKLGVALLVEIGSLTAPASELLRVMVATGNSVVVAGSAGSGKTSMLDALTAHIPPRERVVVLEEQAELELARDNVLSLEASPRATLRQLLPAALGMGPDRVLVGELRGAEALDVVLATTRGHGALLTTVRAAAPREVLARLEAMTLLCDGSAPLIARRAQIASAIHVVVQLARLRDGTRKVTHITEIAGFDLDRGVYDVRDLYLRTFSGEDADGRVTSELAPTGHLPARLEELMAQGYDLPPEMYDAAARLSAGAPLARRP